MAIKRIADECPLFHEWTGVINTSPSVDEGAVDSIDMGSVALSAESTVKAAALHYTTDFNDSVYSNINVWMKNKRNKTGHAWDIEFESAATFPVAALDDPLIAGVEIPGSPGGVWATMPTIAQVLGTADGAASVGTDEYDPVTKKIRWMLLQLTLAAAADKWDTSKEIYQPPSLVLDVARTDWDVTGLREDEQAADLDTGHLFQYSEVTIFEVLTDAAGNEYWMEYEAVKDDSVTKSYTEEHVEWSKGKPTVVYHEARSAVTAGFNFNFAEQDPQRIAQLFQTAPARDATNRVFTFKVGAKTSAVIERKYVIECRTHGGFIIRTVFPRAVVVPNGDYTPGSAEFAEQPFMLKGLASGSQRSVSIETWTDTPVEQSTIPIEFDAD